MADSGNALSERENEILQLVATGASNKEIAQRLFISSNTVKVHLRNIFTKIGVTSRTEAAMYAVNTGLVSAHQAGTDFTPEVKPVEMQEILSPAPEDRAGLIARLRRLTTNHRWFVIMVFSLILLLLIILIFQFVAVDAPVVSESQTKAKWVTLPDMPTARSSLAVVAFKNEIFALGGENERGILDVVEVFTPETGKWSRESPMPWGAADIQAGVIGNKIYIPGGRLVSEDISSTLSVFDLTNNVWTRGANLPAPVSRYTLAVLEDRLYLFGGWDGQQFLDTVLIYDPLFDEWREGSNMSEPRADAAAAVIDDEIHLLGGFNQDGALDLYQVYTLSQNSSEANPWRQEGPLPEPRSGMGAAAVIDVIYLVGGQGKGESTLPTWGHLTKTKEWLKIPAPADENITELRLVLLDTEIYALGGQIGQQATDVLRSFQVLYITVLPFVP